MNKKTHFKYTVSYRKILEVNIYHDYFASGFLKFYDILVSSETNEVFKNLCMVLRKSETGFVILGRNEERFSGSTFSGDINLKFHLLFNDSHFLSYTDLPNQNNLKLHFINKYREKLHANNYVDKECVMKYDMDENSAEINLCINKKNEFFGSSKKPTSKPLSYKILFTSRTIFLRFNFNTNIKKLKGYYITDEDNKFSINKFSKRYLTTGDEVNCLIHEKPILFEEFLKKRLILKKKDEFYKSFSYPLPHPEKENIVYDRNKGVFFGDIYVTI